MPLSANNDGNDSGNNKVRHHSCCWHMHVCVNVATHLEVYYFIA